MWEYFALEHIRCGWEWCGRKGLDKTRRTHWHFVSVALLHRQVSVIPAILMAGWNPELHPSWTQKETEKMCQRKETRYGVRALDFLCVGSCLVAMRRAQILGPAHTSYHPPTIKASYGRDESGFPTAARADSKQDKRKSSENKVRSRWIATTTRRQWTRWCASDDTAASSTTGWTEGARTLEIDI